MLSHAVKKLLDQATGYEFSPVIGMSAQLPICSYKLSDLTNEILNQSQLEVRVWSDDFDQLETIREQIKQAVTAMAKDSWTDCGDYLIRGKLTGGGILPTGDGELFFDSTQYVILTWIKKGQNND